MRPLRIECLESRRLLAGDFFVVPGAVGTEVAIEFQWTSRDAKFNNEIGIFAVSDSQGTVAGRAPGNAGYATAALSVGQTVFASGQGAGAAQTLTFHAGDRLAFFLVQNSTRQAALDALLSSNDKGPRAFFSVDGVNSDGFDHVTSTASGAGTQLSFEDQLNGGDRDFNDAVIAVGSLGVLTTPGATGQSVDVVVTLASREASFHNEIGLFRVDDLRGAIGNLLPGDAGYAQAALASASREILFRGDVGAGQSKTLNLGSNTSFVLYLVQNSSTEEFLSKNPGNATSATPRVFFSLASANPDHTGHVRCQTELTLGFEDLLNGGDRDFNDAVVSVAFGTPSGVAPPDTTPPVVAAALVQDTADPARSATALDRITSNSTIAGTVTDAGGVVQLLTGFDNQAIGEYDDIISQVDSAGAFRLDPNEINAIFGSALTQGSHKLFLRAKDAAGNVSAIFEVSFVYDTLHKDTLGLDAGSDTGVQGELRTDTSSVLLVGTAEAMATVRLVRVANDLAQTNLATASADASGNYQFSGVTLDAGPNALKVFATDAAGNVAETGATITLNRAPTVGQPIGAIDVTMDAADSVIDLTSVFADADNVNDVVRIDTSLGVFDIQLFNTRTPGHATNFLNYAIANQYDGTFVHRSVPGFIVQAGGYEFLSGQTPNYAAVPDNAAVTNEPGLPNSKGTVALAKLSGQPSSGTNEWFVNLGDNVANLDNQNGGFTVFGQVLRDGQTVVNAIAAVPTYNLSTTFSNIPLRNFSGSQIGDADASNFVLLNSVTQLQNPLTYSIFANDIPALVTASISGNSLRLQYAAGQTGTATITIRATDTDGSTVDHTFSVSVSPTAPE